MDIVDIFLSGMMTSLTLPFLNILAGLLFAALPANLFIVVFLLRGGFFTILNNLVESHSMSMVEDSQRNQFAGMRSVFRSIGAAIASYFAGFMLVNRDYQMPFLITGAVILIACGYFWFVVRPMFLKENKENATIID